ncbi:TetR/AcrR family transcriptional regulator [Futiania mangrovi]|uniref:TetR/AcrR family transcriptional regulator n=1 Tax=Futiania mangrovi TaxID=2959716 RepID=A0A9J6PHA6_9PROT|nr:TetR/AcrR family transcriptional regulator [Futiania mangrovii]MCP1335474.1 TetR/AcrR family transcriptional regulator [Futiania mangrovii]
MSRWNELVATTEDRQREKREIVIRMAGAAFGRNGFYSTTLEDVAKSIGLTKAAIYYYFKNKNEILFECHKLAIQIAQKALEDAESEGRNGFEKLTLTVRNYIVGMTSELNFSILVDVSALKPEERSYVVSFRDKFEARMRSFVEEGIADGSIAPCEPKFAIFAIMGAVSWVPSWYSPAGELTGEQVADVLIGFLSNGLSPRT